MNDLPHDNDVMDFELRCIYFCSSRKGDLVQGAREKPGLAV